MICLETPTRSLSLVSQQELSPSACILLLPVVLDTSTKPSLKVVSATPTLNPRVLVLVITLPTSLDALAAMLSLAYVLLPLNKSSLLSLPSLSSTPLLTPTRLMTSPSLRSTKASTSPFPCSVALTSTNPLTSSASTMPASPTNSSLPTLMPPTCLPLSARTSIPSLAFMMPTTTPPLCLL